MIKLKMMSFVRHHVLAWFFCKSVVVSVSVSAGRVGRCLSDCRTEKDTMGDIHVSNAALWGAQTQRSVENFVIGDDEMPTELIRAFAIQKKACALANQEVLGRDISGAIQQAADQVILGGKHFEQFPLVVYQTGSGTQTNMNVNEVLANVANEILGAPKRGTQSPVHPNDHVNRGQSTNDSFPTAMHIAAVLSVLKRMLPGLAHLEKALRAKEEEFAGVVKIGRTHMQDATPLTLGQEFGAWAEQVKLGSDRLLAVLDRLYALPQGGTAVGTGLNQVEGFDTRFARYVAEITGVDGFRTNRNKFEGISAHDAMVELASVQNVIATSFMKIANDVRLLSSGPTGGLGEIWLPANEPGSSIMPGKVNPTQAEAMSMVAAQVMGNAVAVSVANSHGHLDLQAFKPVIIFNVLKSSNLLADVAYSFADKCVVGIVPNLPKVQEHLDKNLMLVTALNPVIGYEKAADVAKTALKQGKSLKQVAVYDKAYLTADQFDLYVVPADMIRPKSASRKGEEL
ncbi:unnamed protein product [Amoebophrya sp. A25]|nr:unnamed protein product [Amoebophrya sp. A25]|eukprot:GSA25T00020152001.1